MTIIVIAGGCTWTNVGWDGSNTRNNAIEAGLPNAVGVHNVGQLAEAWSVPVPSGPGTSFMSQPVVGGGRVFMLTAGQPGRLWAFNAVTGSTLWSASIGSHSLGMWAPALAGDKVIFRTDQGVAAFDAAGQTNCEGVAPARTCQPVWTTSQIDFGTGVQPLFVTGSPIAVGDHVYMQSRSPEAVFALRVADGAQEWVAPHEYGGGFWATLSPDRLFLQTNSHLLGFDRAGVQGCDDTAGAVVCEPIWIGPGSNSYMPVAQSGDKLFDPAGRVTDARGVTNCTGSMPVQCSPMWTFNVAEAPGLFTHQAVANGSLFVTRQAATKDRLYALDAQGLQGCSGMPKTCGPVREYAMPDLRSLYGTSPSVANGVLYIGTVTGLRAFDAAGVEQCAPTATIPLCQPLWSEGQGGLISVAGATVFAATDNALRAYRVAS